MLVLPVLDKELVIDLEEGVDFLESIPDLELDLRAMRLVDRVAN